MRPLESSATISPSRSVSVRSRSQALAICGNCSVKRFSLLDQSVTFVEFLPAKTAVTVELNFVEPFLALGKFLNRKRVHRLDEADLRRWQRFKSFRVH